VGANKKLCNYVQNIDAQMAYEGVIWRFNLPAASHFNGLWESAVKSVKYHLTKIMKDAKLTSNELYTLLCQVEACLNSRPLTPMSNDPNDLESLTTANFFLGGSIYYLPEQDLSKEELNGLKRWKFV